LQARDTVTLSHTAKRLLPWLVAVGFFMESLDTTILNTAVPAIAQALKVPPLSMKAVLATYTLSLAVFIPISGWMANRFGTRRVFASAIGIFTLGSFLCGISTDIHWLVACRVLQGGGGAMMLPVGRLIMVRSFAKSELIAAMTFVAMPGLIGPMLGPVLGGLIIGYFHWSVIFFVNIPIGLCGLVLAHRHLPNYREKRNYPLDIVGMVLFGSGISLLSYVLEVFGETTLSGREMLGLLAISAALLGAYGLNTVRTPHPLLRLSLVRIRSFRVAVTGNLFTRLGIGGIPFLLPLLYQVGLGYSPIQSGLLILPQAFVAMIPPWGNLFIELLKSTALVSLITIADLSFMAQEMNQTTMKTIDIFTLVLLIYLAISLAITIAMRLLENAASRDLVAACRSFHPIRQFCKKGLRVFARKGIILTGRSRLSAQVCYDIDRRRMGRAQRNPPCRAR